jgi:polysaccharide export outer membrane protein
MVAMLGCGHANAWHQYLPAAALLGTLAFSSHLLAEPAGDSRAYKLAPGDQIAVTVFNQPELSGDVLIDGAGNIVVPLLEPLQVKNLTILECQTLIRDRLAQGILRQPSVSVRIIELRPLYVLGDVRTPGAYPFRYGSTVQSAVAVAGGFGLSEPLQSAAVSDFLLADERVRQLSSQKQALLIRLSRLEAQRDGLIAFSPPAHTGPKDGTDIAGMVENEKETFDTLAVLQRGRLDLLRSQKPRLQNEIDALNEQIGTETKQLGVVRQQVDRYDRLLKQGLGTQSADLQFRVIEANQESSLWRLKAGISRLQMDAGELDLKIDEAEASFKRQIATDLREVRDRLGELEVTLPAAREIRDVKLQYAGSLVGIGIARSINVTRIQNGETAVFEATETTPLEPGDIVDVRKLLPWRAAQEGTSAGPSDRQPYQTRTAIPASPLETAAR